MSYTDLHDTDHVIKFKTGLVANINTVVTKGVATEGEPHYATDTDRLYIFDGNNNARIHGLDMLVIFEGGIVATDGEIVWLT